MYNKDRLISLIRDKALSFGNFKLASGQTSNYYIDLSKVVMSYDGLQTIVWGLCDLDEELYWDVFDSIGGPAIGAIPLIAAMSIETAIDRSFFVRKEAKTHGKHDVIEGNFNKGDKVLMLEDVTTSGNSLLDAIKTVESEGGVIVQVYSVLDRESGAKELFHQYGYNFKSLLTISEILAT